MLGNINSLGIDLARFNSQETSSRSSQSVMKIVKGICNVTLHQGGKSPGQKNDNDKAYKAAMNLSSVTAEEDDLIRKVKDDSLAMASVLAETRKAEAASLITANAHGTKRAKAALQILPEKRDDFSLAVAASQQTAREEDEIRQAIEASMATVSQKQNGNAAIIDGTTEEERRTAELETQAMAYVRAMPALEKYLIAQGYIIQDSSGKDNNCLFYSIVQCIYHAQGITESIEDKAFDLRVQYDLRKPGSEKQGLFFDNDNHAPGNGGDATFIVGLVSRALNENIRIKLISPNLFDSENPCVTEGEYFGNEGDNTRPIREVIILNTPGHYQSVVKIA